MRIDRTVFALAVCASAAVCHFVPARAAAPMVKTQVPAHLSFPAIGHVRAEQGGFVWIPANYPIPH